MDIDLLSTEHTLVPLMSSDWENNNGKSPSFIDVADGSFNVDVETDDTLSVEDEPLLELNNHPKQEVRKVNVMDIFKSVKPAASKSESLAKTGTRKEQPEVKVDHRRDIEELEAEENIRLVEENEKREKSGITARDLLTGIHKSKSKRKKAESEPGLVHDGDEDKDQVDEAHVVSETDKDTKIEALGEDIVLVPSDDSVEVVQPVTKSGITALEILIGNQRDTPASEIVELLSSDNDYPESKVKPKKRKYTKRKNKPDGSLVVSFKYKPQHKRLAEIEQKIKQSMNKSTSMKDMFKTLSKKKELPVILKIKPELLKSIDTPNESKFLDTTIIKPGAKSFLDVLYLKQTTTKSNVYKLKELPLPKLTKENMHVTYPEEETIRFRPIDLPAKSETCSVDDLDYHELKSIRNKDEPPYRVVFEEYKGDKDVYRLAKKRVKKLKKNIHYKRFIDLLIKGKIITDIWTNAFKPESAADNLTDYKMIQSMKLWLSNSFTILKRHTKRLDVKSKRHDHDEMDDFVVREEYDESTEDETYIPLMIIAGPEGVGKSSAVYSLVQEASGYVHEINASQYRGRKDIMANLKEMSTTQLVHQNQDTVNDNEFQKGVILFEDVDILFEQDKGFWSVLESLLLISRRPLIVTCNDLSVIPQNILEAASNDGQVYQFKRQKTRELEEYLCLIGLVNNLDVDYSVLEHIIDENHSDLRKCLNNLEMICKNNKKSDVITSVKLETIHSFKPSINYISDITEYSSQMDLFSISNLIENTTYSMINHETFESELACEEAQLDDEELHTVILPFEFNAANELQELLPTYPHAPELLNVNQIKKLDKIYFKSKLKQTKRLTRGALTSSMQLFTFEDEMYNKSVFDLVPKAKYTTDVSPFFREFARFDLSVDQYNEELSEIEANKSAEDLRMEGLFKKRNFEMEPRSLLYGPLKNWN